MKCQMLLGTAVIHMPVQALRILPQGIEMLQHDRLARSHALLLGCATDHVVGLDDNRGMQLLAISHIDRAVPAYGRGWIELWNGPISKTTSNLGKNALARSLSPAQ